jgi:hypothetical protein
LLCTSSWHLRVRVHRGGLVGSPAPNGGNGGAESVLRAPIRCSRNSYAAKLRANRALDGECVVKASATAKHLPLLHAINADRLPGFADGGLVGSGSLAPMVGGVQQSNTINVTIHSSAGTPNQNQDLAKQVHQAVTDAAKSMVARELRTAMRPGGLLKR